MSALTMMPEADAVKAKGIHKQKFGSATKNIVCGDKLCSDVEHDGEANQQSRFQVGGVAQQEAGGMPIDIFVDINGDEIDDSIRILPNGNVQIRYGQIDEEGDTEYTGQQPVQGESSTDANGNITITTEDGTQLAFSSDGQGGYTLDTQVSVGTDGTVTIIINGIATTLPLPADIIARSITVSDVDGDGHLDITVTTETNLTLVYYGDGVGNFAQRDSSVSQSSTIPTVTLNPTSGPLGFETTVSGSNFPPLITVLVRYCGTCPPIDFTTTSDGSFSGTSPTSTTPELSVEYFSGSDWIYTIAPFTITADTAAPTTAPTLPTLSISDVKENEYHNNHFLYFIVTPSAPSETPITFLAEISPGTATDPTDYFALPTTPFTIPAGSYLYQLQVIVVGDIVPEPDETFTVTLSNPTGATILDGTATGTIKNDDTAPLPTLSIADVSVTEGTGGTSTPISFTITSSVVAPTGGIPFTWSTADGTATSATASNSGDYYGIANPTPSMIRAGQTTAILPFSAIHDFIDERDETFTVTISSTSATISDGTATGTIIDDDTATAPATAPPTLSIADLTQNEGNTDAKGNPVTTLFKFTVTLSAPSATPVTFRAAITPVTATTADYTVPPSTTYTIPAGSTTTLVTIGVLGDTVSEQNETFTVTLSSPVGATILDGSAIGTITNDDTATTAPTTSTLTITLFDVQVTERNAGSNINAQIGVKISDETPIPVTVDYTTIDGTAKASDNDYVPKSGTLTFGASTGNTHAATYTQVGVLANGDNKFEPNETFTLKFSNPVGATLANDIATITIKNDDTTSASTSVPKTMTGATLDPKISIKIVNDADIYKPLTTAQKSAIKLKSMVSDIPFQFQIYKLTQTIPTQEDANTIDITPLSTNVDTSGNFYVGDSINGKILKFSPSGTLLLTISVSGAHDALVNSVGDIYVHSLSTSKFAKFTSTGAPLPFGDIALSTTGSGGYIDSLDNLYIPVGNAVKKYSSSGVLLDIITAPQGSHIHDVSVDTTGNVYVVDSTNLRFMKFDKDQYSTPSLTISIQPTQINTSGMVALPSIDVDMDGSIYVVVSSDHKILKYDQAGNLQKTIGSTSGNDLEHFNLPHDIKISGNKLIISDTGNHRILVLAK